MLNYLYAGVRVSEILQKGFEYANMMDCSIKMLATAEKINDKLNKLHHCY